MNKERGLPDTLRQSIQVAFANFFLTDVASLVVRLQLKSFASTLQQTGKTVERQHSKLKLYSLDNENLLDGDILFLERQLLDYAINGGHLFSPRFITFL